MLRVGDTLHHNRYLVLRQLGTGGMGAVYEVLDQDAQLKVALKAAFVHTDAEHVQFAHEAQLLASLDHPALPHVIHYFAEAGVQYLVMELVPGDDLENLLQRQGKPFDVARVLQWADQTLGALEYLHQQTPPIVHRDIKPANLKLDAAGRVKLLDFGISKQQLTLSRTVTVARAVSAAYSPIEQWTQSGTDVRSDIYALGATLYHLVTGHTPVPAPDRLQGTGLPDPGQLNSRCPPAFAQAILRAMAVRAQDRFQSAAELRAVLRRTQPLDFSAVREDISRRTRRGRRALLTAALGGTLLLAGGAVAVWPATRVQGQPPIVDTMPREAVRDAIQANMDQTTNQERAQQDMPEQPDRALGLITSMAVAADGRTAATGFAGGMLRVWRVDDRKELYRLKGHSGDVTALAFAPDGQTLVSGGRDRLLVVWQIGQDTPLRTLKGHTGDIRSIALAPDGTVVASGSEDGMVRIWNTADGTLLHALAGHTGPVTTLAFTRDQQTLASGSEDGTVRMWGVGSGTLLRVLRGYTSDVTALAFGGGDTLAIGSVRGPILLLEHGEDVRVHLDGHSGRVTALTFSQDGQTLASAGTDATLRLWQASTGRALGSHRSSTGAITALVFLQDGAALANGSAEGIVRVWDMKSLLGP